MANEVVTVEGYYPEIYFKPVLDALLSEHERYPFTIVVVSWDARQSELDYRRFRRDIIESPLLPNRVFPGGITATTRGVVFLDGSKILFVPKSRLEDPNFLRGRNAEIVRL